MVRPDFMQRIKHNPPFNVLITGPAGRTKDTIEIFYIINDRHVLKYKDPGRFMFGYDHVNVLTFPSTKPSSRNQSNKRTVKPIDSH